MANSERKTELTRGRVSGSGLSIAIRLAYEGAGFDNHMLSHRRVLLTSFTDYFRPCTADLKSAVHMVENDAKLRAYASTTRKCAE
jgi:hypothetical protein